MLDMKKDPVYTAVPAHGNIICAEQYNSICAEQYNSICDEQYISMKKLTECQRRHLSSVVPLQLIISL
jgi:hypothetical protein